MVTIGLGWLAYSTGRGIRDGTAFPGDRRDLFASGAFAWMAWRSSKYAKGRFERLNSDLLLTTVPARTVIVGFLGFVCTRLSVTLVGPTLGIAVGAAIGLESPSVAVSVLVAVAAMAVLAVCLGTTVRLAGRLLAQHLSRISFYRDLVVVFGWIPLVIGAILLDGLDVGFSLRPAVSLVASLPVAWFVDLALVGTADGQTAGRNAAATLAGLVFTVPVFVGGATVLARRIWEHTPTGSSKSRGSHSLHKLGVLERLAGSRVPRAMYTVARERWLIERRVPRGLLSAGYPLVVMALFGFPLLLLMGGSLTLLVFFAVTLGLAAGSAFGSDPIGTEYRTLPMVLTSCSGVEFVGGALLAVAVAGAVPVAGIVVALGILSPLGPLQIVLTALLGSSVCLCTGAVALAIGFGADRSEYGPVPFFFTDVPIYAEQGRHGFVRTGTALALALLVSTPAFVGTSPDVYNRLAAVGVPVAFVQTGSLVLTILVVAAVATIAARIAIRRFRSYHLIN